MSAANVSNSTLTTRQQQTGSQTGTERSVRVLAEGKSFTSVDDSRSAADDYISDTRSNRLNADQNYAYSAGAYDSQQQRRDEYIRHALHLETGAAIDYNNLRFPPTATPDNTMQAGTSYNIAPMKFSLSIPSNGNDTPESYVTPDGEYQVEVTDDKLTFTINLPQN